MIIRPKIIAIRRWLIRQQSDGMSVGNAVIWQ